MTDSARNVSTFGCEVADRISSWLKENPDATEYCINEEIEAKQLLITIAAAIKLMIRDMPKGIQRDLANKYRADMCAAAAQSRALDYIREINESDPLEFLGVKITVPPIILQ